MALGRKLPVSRMINIGLIGAGNISDTHARAATAIPGVTVAAVHAPTLEHAQRLAARHGAVAYDTLESLLSHRPLDIVAIGSPSGLHAEQGIAAAKHGLHVLIEKPIDVTTARTDALIAEAERAGVTIGVIFQDRLKPDVQRLKTLVAAGRLGSPILATAHVKWYRPPSYYRDSRWRGTRTLDGGGALMNQGIHTVDLLLWLFGPVRCVYSRRIELTGSNGTLMLDGDDLTAVDLHDATDAERPTQTSGATVSAASPVVADASAHLRVFEDFIAAVAARRAPCCDGPGGRHSVALVEAIYTSARTNSPIAV